MGHLHLFPVGIHGDKMCNRFTGNSRFSYSGTMFSHSSLNLNFDLERESHRVSESGLIRPTVIGCTEVYTQVLFEVVVYGVRTDVVLSEVIPKVVSGLYQCKDHLRQYLGFRLEQISLLFLKKV